MSFPTKAWHRALFSAVLALASGLWAGEAQSQAVEVPVRLQAELLAKVAVYDRMFSVRARGRALVFVVIKPGNPESERIGEQILSELAVLPDMGGLPHAEELVRHTSAAGLAELIKSRAPAILYLSTGLLDQMETIANALDGLSILSVGVSAAYVSKRSVLGFDAQSGKPKLVVHLTQARRQHVAFRPELLKLTRVIQ